MFWTIAILGIVGLVSAYLIYTKIRNSFKKGDCGSCCGCSSKGCGSNK